MAGEITDYDSQSVAAAKSVILELVHLLGEYREDIVLIGGWIPSLLIPEAEIPHVGSADVDLALNHENLAEAGYEKIGALLENHGYKKSETVPLQYFRESNGIQVQIDLLAGQYGGTGKRRRHQRVQDVMPRKARGCDLAFEIESRKVKMKGTLPDGANDSVIVPCASIVPFLVMKAIALGDRLKQKDAYDIWYCLRFYPSGLDSILAEFGKHTDLGLVKEALQTLSEKISTINEIGPVYAGRFDQRLSQEEQEVRTRDAFERVQYLLRECGFQAAEE